MDISMFYITVGSKEEGERLAEIIIEKRLAACVNLIEGVSSFFFWEEKAQKEEESIIIGKTRSSLIQDLVDLVKEHHSYTLPCIVSWPLGDGHSPFLEWVAEETEDQRERYSS